MFNVQILAKKNYDEKCDIWSLGIMMMEAIGFYNVGILVRQKYNLNLIFSLIYF